MAPHHQFSLDNDRIFPSSEGNQTLSPTRQRFLSLLSSATTIPSRNLKPTLHLPRAIINAPTLQPILPIQQPVTLLLPTTILMILILPPPHPRMSRLARRICINMRGESRRSEITAAGNTLPPGGTCSKVSTWEQSEVDGYAPLPDILHWSLGHD